MSYNYEDIVKTYNNVGVSKGSVVLVKTDLRYLGAYESSNGLNLISAHFNALADLIDLSVGTLVVSTATGSLINTDKSFDISNTPSEMGVLTEFVRQQKEAIRSFHPFNSYTAIGAHSDGICQDVSRHAFGIESPKARLLELDPIYLSIGLEPRWTCSYIHHIEMLMGVPYRYTKEFNHPVVQNNGQIKKELFYTHVWYRGLGLKENSNINENIFKYYYSSGRKINQAELGQGLVYGYRCRDFYGAATEYLRDDIYGWLNFPPPTDSRPWRK